MDSSTTRNRKSSSRDTLILVVAAVWPLGMVASTAAGAVASGGAVERVAELSAVETAVGVVANGGAVEKVAEVSGLNAAVGVVARDGAVDNVAEESGVETQDCCKF